MKMSFASTMLWKLQKEFMARVGLGLFSAFLKIFRNSALYEKMLKFAPFVCLLSLFTITSVIIYASPLSNVSHPHPKHWRQQRFAIYRNLTQPPLITVPVNYCYPERKCHLSVKISHLHILSARLSVYILKNNPNSNPNPNPRRGGVGEQFTHPSIGFGLPLTLSLALTPTLGEGG